jgi:hypothetical protein
MRVALVLLVAALAALAAAVVFVRAQDDEPAQAPRATATPGYEQRARLSERISRDREKLADQGVFLVGVTLEEVCARVALLNPTPANVAYVEARYVGACVAAEPAAPAKTCGDTPRELTRDGRVSVPDVRDLGLAQASRRVLAADLTFTAGCLGDEQTTVWAPGGPADELLRVVEQCPRPGERVRAGTEVALEATATLPGGFRHRVGALDEAATGSGAPCGDGRNPRG